MKKHFLKLLDYNSWANQRFMECLADCSIINNKIYLLFSHVLTAEEIWLCRAKGEDAPLQRLWQQYPTAKLQQMAEENTQLWKAHLNGSKPEALEQEITYQNSRGETFHTPLQDIITHMVNHGAHHRGQMASLMQQEKVQPPVSDYIFYLREQQAAAL